VLLEVKSSTHHTVSPDVLDRIKLLKINPSAAAAAVGTGTLGGRAARPPASDHVSARTLPAGKVEGAPAPQQHPEAMSAQSVQPQLSDWSSLFSDLDLFFGASAAGPSFGGSKTPLVAEDHQAQMVRDGS
jgi:hypothetical protein